MTRIEISVFEFYTRILSEHINDGVAVTAEELFEVMSKHTIFNEILGKIKEERFNRELARTDANF